MRFLRFSFKKNILYILLGVVFLSGRLYGFEVGGFSSQVADIADPTVRLKELVETLKQASSSLPAQPAIDVVLSDFNRVLIQQEINEMRSERAAKSVDGLTLDQIKKLSNRAYSSLTQQEKEQLSAASLRGYFLLAETDKNLARSIVGFLKKIKENAPVLDISGCIDMTPREGFTKFVLQTSDVHVSPFVSFASSKDVPLNIAVPRSGSSRSDRYLVKINGKYLKFSGSLEKQMCSLEAAASSGSVFNVSSTSNVWAVDGSIAAGLKVVTPEGDLPVRLLAAHEVSALRLKPTDSWLRCGNSWNTSNEFLLKLVTPRYWVCSEVMQPASLFLYRLERCLGANVSLFVLKQGASGPLFVSAEKGSSAPNGYDAAIVSLEIPNLVRIASLDIPSLDRCLLTSKIDFILDKMATVVASQDSSESDIHKFTISGNTLAKSYRFLPYSQQKKLLSCVMV